jgi:hypothetical protein
MQERLYVNSTSKTTRSTAAASKGKPKPAPKPAREHLIKNTHAMKKGIYVKALLDEEEESLFADITVDNIDEEIKMFRIQLRRALNAEAAQSIMLADPAKEKSAAILYKLTQGSVPGGRINTVERVVKDYGADVERKARTLLKYLELRHQILVGNQNEMDELARIEARKQAGVHLDRLFTVATDEEMKEAAKDFEEIKKKGTKK